MSPEVGQDQAAALQRIRAALAGKCPASAPFAGVVETEDWRERARRVRAEAFRRWGELLPRFGAELEGVGGNMHLAGEADVAAVIGQIANDRGLTRGVSWGEEVLGLPGLLARLKVEGVEVGETLSPGVSDSGRGEILYGAPSWAEVGLTGVDYAIAASGSLVLQSGSGKNRLVSCLPTIHIAILKPGQLLESLEEVGILLESESNQALPGETSRVVDFITGPSRTADIEMSLTRGIHGPKEVHVIAVS
ncbi:MAG TPA: lactate utilization protein [Candidatus Methylomirabilis sp.]|nr:lactate utilization protein [Candidatus Methylomirabilis sp.]HSC72167.1 lactate utilization protein [Candidatus Methylomirabilis sp.]